jgi:hypothetical protein
MSRRFVLVVAGLCLIAGTCMVFHPESVYRSPQVMDAYFGGQTPKGSLTWSGSWSWSEEPFRFRLLFHGLVDALAAVLGSFFGLSLNTYWCAYVTVAIASVVFAGWATALLLRTAGCSERQSMFGLAVWLALPPIHLAFVMPTQTKEDFLAYGLLAIGLVGVIKERLALVTIVSIVGALTRETLLLVPLIYALTARGNARTRFLPLVAGLLTLASIRLVLSSQGHDATGHFEKNLSNPWVLAAAIGAIFGAGWAILIPSLHPRRLFQSSRSQLSTLVGHDTETSMSMVDRVERMAGFCVLLLLSVHILFGRVQETRITALAAIFVVLIAGRHLAVRMRGASCRKRTALTMLLAVSAIIIFEALGLGSQLRARMSPKLGSFASKHWWLEFYLQLVLLLMLIVGLIKTRGQGTETSPSSDGPRNAFNPRECGALEFSTKSMDR